MSQRQPRRPEKSARDQDDENVTEREIDRDALTNRGTITCGDPDRRELYEQVGREDAVEFIGDAAEAGRQAERDDDWESDLHE
ncbi:hypothetical protein [Halococcus sp. PRR34]|uniref:hypothetical protein n=1 Tax=Halococcus sp. PRR34 TaxID=3020830 RepID=UPI002360C1B8|nr:hypothetical protein [Halococcus sp. PRR34]